MCLQRHKRAKECRGPSERTSALGPSSTPLTVGANVDVSNEDTPQSETSITIDPDHASLLVGGLE
jgi:hypothetical protein